MTHVEKARDVALSYFKGEEALEQKIAELKAQYKEERITGRSYNEQISLVNTEMGNLRSSIVPALDELQTAYSAAVDSWGALAGDKLHEDVRLLDGHFALTGKELSALSEKHRENATVQRAIREYANDKGLHYDAATPLPEDKKAAYASLCATIRNAVEGRNLLARALIEDDAQFSKLLSPAFRHFGFSRLVPIRSLALKRFHAPKEKCAKSVVMLT